MISHLRNRLESLEGWIYTIRMENQPQKATLTIQKDDTCRRLCPKGGQKYASHEVPHLQSFFNMI